MRTLTTIVLLVTWTASYSQYGGLKGQVRDNSEHPFAWLDIKIANGDSVVAWTVTNQNGEYEFKNVNPGLYDVRILHLGLRERIIKDVTITENEIRRFDIIHPGPCKESDKMCPKGHTHDLIPIVYGLPGKRLLNRSEKGQIRLGGCIVTDCDPKWYCKTHDIEF